MIGMASLVGSWRCLLNYEQHDFGVVVYFNITVHVACSIVVSTVRGDRNMVDKRACETPTEVDLGGLSMVLSM